MVRGENQGVVGGASRAKPRGPVGGKEQPLARQRRWEEGAMGSLCSVHADAPWPPDYLSRRRSRWES